MSTITTRWLSSAHSSSCPVRCAPTTAAFRSSSTRPTTRSTAAPCAASAPTSISSPFAIPAPICRSRTRSKCTIPRPPRDGRCHDLRGLLSVRLASTHDYGIVRVADERAEVAGLHDPERVEGVTVDVRHQRRDRPALWHALGLGEDALHHHPGTYPPAQQPDHPAIADPAADESQHQGLVEPPEVVLEVQVH